MPGAGERRGAGREDYHDPTARLGAPPARSALTLRLVLAGFGLLVSVGGALALSAVGAPSAVVGVFALLAAAALVDLVVVVRRKRRGEPG